MCVCMHVSVCGCAVIKMCVCVWIEWDRMAIKVPKCRFLSLHRGCVAANHSLSLAGMSVPSVIETHMKFLGLPITANLDTLDHRSASLSLSSYLLRVDSSLNCVP